MQGLLIVAVTCLVSHRALQDQLTRDQQGQTLNISSLSILILYRESFYNNVIELSSLDTSYLESFSLSMAPQFLSAIEKGFHTLPLSRYLNTVEVFKDIYFKLSFLIS